MLGYLSSKLTVFLVLRSRKTVRFSELGPVSRKSRKLFGPEKPFVKLRPACSVKLVFSYVVKGIKIKITAKFRVSRRLNFEDTKRIMSPEIRPKSFGTFEKQAPDNVRRHLISLVFSFVFKNVRGHKYVLGPTQTQSR